MKTTLLKTLTPELHLVQHNDIPVLHLKHAVGTAKISLQGAQLLSWQPQGVAQDVLWLSEVEPLRKWQCYSWWHTDLLSLVWWRKTTCARHSSYSFMAVKPL